MLQAFRWFAVSLVAIIVRIRLGGNFFPYFMVTGGKKAARWEGAVGD